VLDRIIAELDRIAEYIKKGIKMPNEKWKTAIQAIQKEKQRRREDRVTANARERAIKNAEKALKKFLRSADGKLAMRMLTKRNRQVVIATHKEEVNPFSLTTRSGWDYNVVLDGDGLKKIHPWDPNQNSKCEAWRAVRCALDSGELPEDILPNILAKLDVVAEEIRRNP